MLSSSSTMGMNALQVGSNTYGGERVDSFGSGDADYLNDPATGGFFNADYKKHDDLKQMLDGSKDNLKLEAMKRIIGMIAKGRDASELFPAVVKNVVSKNIEVKKLVYVYLVRYAEEQQDLALLSISTFQRALKDPNQLIRASALRVLSSIRVSMIVPIVMLAIRDSASDLSPYVRKTAAHAIPKLYSLDPEQKEELITVIDKLLSDRTTLVVGSAVMAFEEVCPERVDLIHKSYRKLCNFLVDVDEWGQIIIINMLTRYARTQFVDPNRGTYNINGEEEERPFYEETSSESETEKAVDEDSSKDKVLTIDMDHRLLLRQTKPLLQSRNASVVMAVAQLYHHVAPRGDVPLVARALVRLLRSHREVQSVVLTCIASMSLQRKAIFEPFMKSFFVRTSDATHIKLLKLEILTNLATQINITDILREFQTYINSNDKDFVAATIQAIGQCAASIKEVSDTCLTGLVHLLSNRDEYVVAESVVVIKKLLQNEKDEHFDIISQMAKLLDFITVPAARAAILWLIGEYNERIPKIAPDVLRKLAITFVDEENVVKLQVLNLAVKLYLTNQTQTELLCQYVFNLARYDTNYDIRDRARFLRQFIFPANEKPTILSKNARKIFLSAKPAPALQSKHTGRDQFQLGSLSHYLNMTVSGYNDLPIFPEIAPDPTVRNVEISPENKPKVDQSLLKREANSKRSTNNSDDSEEESSSENSSSSESESEEESDEVNSEGNSTEKKNGKKSYEDTNNDEESDETDGSTDTSSESSSEDSSGSESDTESESNDEVSSNRQQSQPVNPVNKKQNNEKANTAQKPKSNLDLLLDLDDIPSMAPIMTPSLGGFLTPSTEPYSSNGSKFDLVGPCFVSSEYHELLNKVNGYGLQINYRYNRAPHLFSSKMISMELTFMNNSTIDITDIKLCQPKNLPVGVQINEFASVTHLGPSNSVNRVLGIDFNDSSQSINFEIQSSCGFSKVQIRASVGEQIRAVTMSVDNFKEERNKLRGMNEHSFELKDHKDWDGALSNIFAKLLKSIYVVANVACITTHLAESEKGSVLFAGQTVSSKCLVLITVDKLETDKIQVSVNCEKMVIGSMLLNEIKTAMQIVK